MTKLHTWEWSKIYSKVPTGYLQVTHHRKIPNLDPQGSVATGEPDPQVALPAGYLCGPGPVSSPKLFLTCSTYLPTGIPLQSSAHIQTVP